MIQQEIDPVGTCDPTVCDDSTRRSPCQPRLGPRFSLINIADEEGGVTSSIQELPCQSVEEARRLVGALPRVRVFDEMKHMLEWFEQQRDAEAARQSAS